MNADLLLVLGVTARADGLDDAIGKGAAQWPRLSHLAIVRFPDGD